jgi:DNA processing protein
MTDELRALLALQLVPNLGPMRTRALLDSFGSAQAVLQASPGRLGQTPGIGDKLSNDIANALRTIDVDGEVSLMEKHRVGLRLLGQTDYPVPLAEISDAPYLLYVRGSLLPEDVRAVAIVGSRHCTDYGKRTASRLAGDLAKAGYVVVSGLARGIDGAAHRGALQAGGRTLAVLAGGLSRIYPPEHRDLADEVERQGALVTESSMKQEPIAALFPARNRIISGLCKAVVLVEAAQKSGALITAEHAGNQGRTVLAVPGAIDNESSGGTNALIRQGAILCRGVDDILEEVEGVSNRILAEKNAPPAPPPVPPNLDETQRRVWDCLAAGSKHVDEMVQQLGLDVAPLAGMLLTMEMKKIVRRLPGNRYERA